MSNKFIIGAIIIFVFVVMAMWKTSRYLNHHYMPNQANTEKSKENSKLNETTPNLIQQVNVETHSLEEVKQLEAKLIQKYDLNIWCSTFIGPSKCFSFYNQLLADEVVAEKLSNYKVPYFASNLFSANHHGVWIDVRLSPREVLEYIQTH